MTADFPRILTIENSRDCCVTPVGKRRDGGTRYWCLTHKADATAKYGRPSYRCRAAYIAPISPGETMILNMDEYQGGVALWGAVPPVYDTTRLPLERGIHVHARKEGAGLKDIHRTVRAVRLTGGSIPENGVFFLKWTRFIIWCAQYSDLKCGMSYVLAAIIRILIRTGSACICINDISAPDAENTLEIRFPASAIRYGKFSLITI